MSGVRRRRECTTSTRNRCHRSRGSGVNEDYSVTRCSDDGDFQRGNFCAELGSADDRPRTNDRPIRPRRSRVETSGSARVDCDLRVFGKTSTTPFASKSRAGDRHSGQHERWREVKERRFAR